MRTGFLAIFIAWLAFTCEGQTVAPTPETVGPVRGDDVSGYNIVNSFETGYRFVDVSGNVAKYKSDENFGNGIRLLSGSFSMNSKSGNAKWFDDLVLTTAGLGGDPYESAGLRVGKNRIYQYDLSWRKNDYVNPGLTTDGSEGQHLLNTTYTLQDHNLTLFPRSWIRFTLGYSRSDQSGAGISTVQLYNASGPFDATGQVFPVFTNVKRVQNDYQLGGELHFLGFTLNWLHGWEDFKDDTPFYLNAGTAAGAVSAGGATLNSFQRSEPNHGTSPYWQVGLFRDAHWVSVNSRFTYTAGERAFVSNESALGTNQFGALANQQIVTSGTARRPVATGNLNVTFLPTSKLNIITHTSIYNVRTEGNSAYIQYDNATQSADLLYFQFLGVRTIETGADAQYQFRNWLEFHGGYDYSDRRIESSPQFAFAGSTSPVPYVQTNILNSGLFGLKLRPVKGLSITLNGEIGQANHPFTPRSDKNYHALSGRADYKLLKTLRFTAQAKSDYNENSVSLSSYGSHARIYSGSVSFTPKRWFSMDASASKSHVDTLGGIAFFTDSQLLQDQLSYYVSNLYSATLMTHFSYKRLDLSVGYARIQDRGDGRTSPTATVIGPNLAAFETAQTFPLKLQVPQGRLSVRLYERLRWNFGYQYFGYHETFATGENYLAHTGYTSLLWSF
jgi:hypothetical protein